MVAATFLKTPSAESRKWEPGDMLTNSRSEAITGPASYSAGQARSVQTSNFAAPVREVCKRAVSQALPKEARAFRPSFRASR